MRRWAKLALAGSLGAGGLAWPRLRPRSLPLPALALAPHPGGSVPYAGLVTSSADDLDEPARIEGQLPAALDGTLYINGPGLFERGGLRKRNLLDGDGLITAFVLAGARAGAGGAAQLLARFVRTDKLRAEEAAGRYLHATWTTQRPGGWLRNLGNRFPPRGQAGVTVKRWDGRLFAFDEGVAPWELDPATLETLRYETLGLGEREARFSAHPKVDPVTHEWIHFGLEYGPRTRLHLMTFGPGMCPRWHRVVPVAGAPYMHDFAVSHRHIVVIRHPADVAPLAFLSGFESFKDSMRWRPRRGNQVMVFDRGGAAEPLVLETDAAWMWHALNAYDRGDETIVDFVGYDHPDHFLGEEGTATETSPPTLSAVMRGGRDRSVHPGKVRRYVIDRARRTIRQEILDHGHHDFPFVDPRRSTRQHRYGYFAAGRPGEWLFSAVARVNMETGDTQRYDFGPRQFCLEPVFAPRPGPVDLDGTSIAEHGWLLVLVHDGLRNAARLAVLDAEHVAAGPVAEVHLDHPLPFRFHGTWWPSA